MHKRLFRKALTSIVRCLKFRFFAVSLGIVSVTSFALIFYKGLPWKTSDTHVAELHHRLSVIDVQRILANKAAEESTACKLPVLDPFHPSVVNFMKDLGKLNCEGVSYSSFENNVLRVEGEGIVSAQYRKIERPQGNDFDVVLSDPVQVLNTSGIRASAMDQKGTFSGNVAVDYDFIRVDVKTSSGETKSDVHMRVFPKKEVLEREQKPGGIPLNVAFIMFDSTSHANFKRKLPKTLEYLTKNLNTVFLQGETIVGDGTTAQLCGMFTGIDENKQPEARRRMSGSQPVDRWRWIFRNYKDKGYATMFSEDIPGLAAFNYRLHGFKDPPTDHFSRPFWIETDKILRGKCINNRPAHNVSLNYLLSFFRSYKDRPNFSFLSHAALSHDNVNMIGYIDEDLTHFLQTFQRESYENNTMLIIFGDHGHRFADLRKTIQGKLEERFPLMSITLPKWFLDKYSDLHKNLLQNSRVLTSPFDVYATLRHILSYPQYPSDITTGQSLFSRIDERNRTCASAGVEDHWCPCLDLEAVSLEEPEVTETAKFVVTFINGLTSQNDELRQLCQRLKLKEIKSAFREMPKEAMQRFVDTKRGANDECDYCAVVLGEKSVNTLAKDTLYQLQFVTSPNEGFYEASVRMKKGVPSLVGDISRVDAYRDQPYCIASSHPSLTKYCYCSPKEKVN